MSTLDNFTLQDIIEKIQKLIKLKYLRINEFIRDYDFLHNGSITIFIILFHCKRFIFNEADLLCEKYTNQEKENN